jgi:hypothetical protein
MQTIDRQIAKIEVFAQEVKLSSRRNYNPLEWDSKVDWYNSFFECKFYYDEEYNEYFAVYRYSNDSPRYMQVIMYSSSLTANGFQNGYIGDKYIFFYRYPDGLCIENNESNRKVLSNNSAKNQCLFYYN